MLRLTMRPIATLATLAVLAAACACTLIALPSRLAAATHYVSPRGSDGAGGQAPGSAWRTLARLRAAPLGPGDSVLLARGGVWRETLVPAWAGSAGAPITVGAYGTGADPIVSGADLVAGWTPESEGGTTVHWVAFAAEPPAVFEDDARLQRVAARAGLASPGTWWWEAASGRLYVRLAAGDPPSSHLLEVAVRGLALDGARAFVDYSHLVLEKAAGSGFVTYASDQRLSNVESRLCAENGFVIRGSRVALAACRAHDHLACGILCDNRSESVTLTDVDADHNGDDGILLVDATGAAVSGGSASFNGSAASEGNGLCLLGASRSTVTGFRSHHNRGNGLLLINGCSEIAIRRGEFHDNAAGPWPCSGVRFDTNTTACSILYARAHGNESTGLVMEDGTNGCLAAYNLFYANARGMTLSNSPGPGNRHLNNVCHGNSDAGMSIVNYLGPSPRAEVKNNIFSRNGSGMSFNRYGTAAAHSIDANLYFASVSGAVDYDGTTYSESDLAGGRYRAATGYEARGLAGDPRLADPASGDFRPGNGSPAIDAGLAAGLDEDFAGTRVPQGRGVDMGAFEHTDPVQGVEPPAGGGDGSGGETGDPDALAPHAPALPFAFPNPARLSAAPAVRFAGVPAAGSVQIFTLDGRLVRELDGAPAGGEAAWDLRSRHARPVAPGVFLVIVRDRERRPVHELRLAIRR